MIFSKLGYVMLLVFAIFLLMHPSFQTIRRGNFISDVHGNLLSNNDVRFRAPACCLVPTCTSPHRCYETTTCGYLCSTGKYPAVDQSPTPGYQLKNSYYRYACRFGDCRDYEFTCGHCQDPRKSDFNIYLIREDCKDCYYKD